MSQNALRNLESPTGVAEESNLQISNVRYSDEKLNNFRQIILKKLEIARFDLNNALESINNINDTSDTGPTFKVLEEGQTTLSKEEVGNTIVRLKKYIVSLENAIIRIDNKTYGVCRETGKLIPEERLCSVPHATLCADSEEKRNGKTSDPRVSRLPRY